MGADLRIGDVVYEGARTTVYRAKRSPDDLPVLLKVLRTGYDDDVHRARLRRELAITHRVDTPGVVKAYGVTEHEGRLALILEDFGGESLSRTLAAHAPLTTTLPIAVAIARALGVIHAAGIVHRDLKPSNVIHRPQTGEIKITDFGIAILRGDAQTRSPGALEGTLAYMAPEQTGRMRGAVDRRADLYALGVLLYEIFTGCRPFEAKDALEWIHAHTAQIPRAPSLVAPELPLVLSQIVSKLLSKAPEERYQTAEGLERDLDRCNERVQRGSPVEAFPIAEADVSGEFQLTERVYGRDRELAVMQETFDRVAGSSQSEILLLAGYSGIGKSSLARELRGSASRRDGYFASGKFDQYRRHVPYAAVAQAGNALVHQLLAASPQHLAAFRAALLSALDGNGRVLVELIPELDRVLGPQPEVAELPPTGMQNRLGRVVRAFMRALGAPVVLFLDDMQWADAASLDLLDALLGQGGEVPVLAVLSYRDHEVTSGHPLLGAIDRLRSAGAPVHSLVLGPLDVVGVRAMIHDTLHTRDARSVDDLANLAMAKTAGNPFFVREFLRTLHLDGLLRFDAARTEWRFEAELVAARSITENVVHLMLERLHQLPAGARAALRIAAFLGNELEVEDLAAITGESLPAVTEHLQVASEQGLISVSSDLDGRSRARFGHDRIQQAAYALTADAERSKVHREVGLLLWKRLTLDPTASRTFEVANHLDLAFDRLADAVPKDHLLDLFLDAARRAKGATAYLQARTYLARAGQLLGDAGWTERFAETFDLHVDLAECDYLAGRLDRASALFDELLGRAHTDLERARVYYLQIRLLQVGGNFAEAASLSLRSFALFGLVAPEGGDEAARVVAAQYAVVDGLLGDRAIADHVDDPRMTDPNVRMLVDLLEVSGPPIYMVKPALFPWIALELVIHSLRHGNAEASCYGYGIYALLRAAVLGDVEGGYAFSLLSIRLNEKLGAVKLEGCMLHLLGDHVNFWRNPVATDLPILERGFAACVRAGDHIYSNYIGFQSPWHLYESGAALAEVTALTTKYAAFARETSYTPVLWTIRAEQQFVLSLLGETNGRGELTSDTFDESEALAEVRKAQFGCGIVYIQILQLIARYTFGDFVGALSAAEGASGDLGSAFSMPIYVSFGVYHALTLAQLYESADEATRARSLEAMNAHHASMTQWARACPANFADKAALVGAEIARVTGDVPNALRLYEVARLAARSQGFLQYEALACELAAAVYGRIGVSSVKRAHLADAYTLYGRWGATGKAMVLLSQDRGLEAGIRSPEATASQGTASTTQTTTGREIDLTSVLKVAQSLSAEIVLPRLLGRLMSVVIEYAGAERGSLVLLEGETLVVAAEAAIDDRREATNVEVPRPAAALPSAILRYVQRTSKHVLIDDAANGGELATDPYFKEAKHRSVLCKPIARQGRLIGMFYLENDLVAGAFGPSRLATLGVLASQTAISIENSRLYQASQAAVLARDEFLSIASHELRTPLAPLAMQVHRLTNAVRKGTFRDFTDVALLKLAATCDGQIVRLSRLVGALLDVSRIGSGTMTLQRERMDLGALASDTVDRHAAELAAAGCGVSLRVETSVTGEWDRMRVEQVVTNLLTNAVKFGRDRPIEVTVERVGGSAVLAVVDHGVGVKEIDRDRIFDRFERVQSSTNVDGLGLGLFILRAIVEAHDGRVRVSDTEGGGATFRVTLPTG